MTVKVEGKNVTVAAAWVNAPIGSMSTASIIQEMGLLDKSLKAIEKRKDILKEGLNSRVSMYRKLHAGRKELDDREYVVPAGSVVAVAKWVSQARFDTEKTKTEMGDEWYQEHCKVISFAQYSIKEAEKAPLGAPGQTEVRVDDLEPAALLSAGELVDRSPL